MALVRPRLNDHYDLPFTQSDADFAIPLLDEDIPLYADPFLLWNSPSQQDNSLHTTLISSFNHLGRMAQKGKEDEAAEILVALSECREVGLGSARNKQGHRIGKKTALEILSLFAKIPQVQEQGFEHIEEIQLFVDQIASDRISDITCSVIKSFLIDFTIDQCMKLAIPRSAVVLTEVLDTKRMRLTSETVELPVNPTNGSAVLLVPKRWLRYQPWINYQDYFDDAYCKSITQPGDGKVDRIAVLNYNRQNYGMVQSYVREKERTQGDCKNDPLFKAIPIISAKRKLAEIRKLPTGKIGNADKRYEDNMCQLMASMLYPQLDFADEQSRTDSGVLIRDLIFYNNRTMDFLRDIREDYGSRQIVFELKNVAKIEREHINQVNRYMADQFGKFGVILTRNPLPKAMLRSTIDLWSGQRRCIIALTDADIEQMVTVFESRQRLPIEVVKKVYVEFMRACPS